MVSQNPKEAAFMSINRMLNRVVSLNRKVDILSTTYKTSIRGVETLTLEDIANKLVNATPEEIIRCYREWKNDLLISYFIPKKCV